MKFLHIALILSLIIVGSIAGQAKVRYANSMPQFGSVTVRAFLPQTLLFSSAAGGSLTSYANLTAPHWFIFSASYNRNVTALSFPYNVDANSFYSLFTYQTNERRMLNKLISDRCQNNDNSVALLRAVNLVQYNYPINVYNLSNNVQIFDNVSYAEASSYVSVPVGDYVVYWTSAAVAKRGIHGSNVSGDPFLYGGKTYTYWVLPSGSFIVEDCVNQSAKKRNVNQVSIASLRMRRSVKRENEVSQNENEESVKEEMNGDNASKDANAQEVHETEQ